MAITENPAGIRPENCYSTDQLATFRSRGDWRDESLAQWVDHWASTQPDVVAFSDGDAEVTWAQLRHQGYRLGAELRRRGIRAGDRIQVQLPNWVEFAIAYVGITRIGAVLVPTMPIYRHDEVEYIINHSNARMAFVAHTFRGFDYAAMHADIADRCAGLDAVVAVRADDSFTGTRWEDLIGDGPTPDDDELGPFLRR